MGTVIEQLYYIKDFTQHPSFVSVSVNTLSGLIAGLIVQTAFYPLEYLEAALQLGLLPRSNLIDSVKVMYSTKGILCFFKGALSSVLGQALAWGYFFFTFELCKFLLTQESVSLSVVFISCKLYLAVIGGAVWTSISLPFFTVRTRVIKSKRTQNYSEILHEYVESQPFSSLFTGYLVSLVNTVDGGS